VQLIICDGESCKALTLPFDRDRTAVGPAEDEERIGVVGEQWFSSGVQGVGAMRI